MKNPTDNESIQPIFLNIADYVIKIVFTYDSYSPMVQNWYDRIITRFHDWVISDSKHYDRILQFSQANLYIGSNATKKTYYVKIYGKKNSTTFETCYYISFYQLSYVLQIILHELFRKSGGFIMHASANNISERSACIFIGRSNAGKTTISNSLHPLYPKLVDDTTVLKNINRDYYLYPVPMDSPVNNILKPVKKYKITKVFILRKSHQCKIESISNLSQLLPLLIPSIWAKDIRETKLFLSRLNNFIHSSCKFYILHFTQDKEELIHLFNFPERQ